MKKLFCFLIGLMLTLSTNAQTVTQNPKFFDNWYAGASVGLNTPLSFNQMFPLNTTLGLKVGKEITPIYGVELESFVSLNDHISGHTNGYINTLNSKTAFKGINTTLSGTFNITNAFSTYDTRPFEVIANAGIGWAHIWGGRSNDNDELTTKTGLDLMFNFRDRIHSIVLSPAIYWNLTCKDGTDACHFHKGHAYLSLALSYVYHFKNSNKTHSFVEYDIDSYNRMINNLREKTSKTRVEYIKEPIIQHVINPFIVTFAQGSYYLTEEAKSILNDIPLDSYVSIYGYASPEGTTEFNISLSKNRAIQVANYLQSRGIQVDNVIGYGSTGETSQRVVVVEAY
jgi:hypothetical protein